MTTPKKFPKKVKRKANLDDEVEGLATMCYLLTILHRQGDLQSIEELITHVGDLIEDSRALAMRLYPRLSATCQHLGMQLHEGAEIATDLKRH